MTKNIEPVNGPMQHNFLVMNGSNAGAQFELPQGTVVSAGGSIESDIVIHDAGADPWKINLENREGNVYLTVLEGDVNRNDELLSKEESFFISKQDRFQAGEVEFRILSTDTSPIKQRLGKAHPVQTEPGQTNPGQIDPPLQGSVLKEGTSDFGTDDFRDYSRPAPGKGTARKSVQPKRLIVRKILLGASILCVAVATVSALYVVTSSSIMARTDSRSNSLLFTEKLEESDFDSLDHELGDDGETVIVSGILETREERNEIIEISRLTDTKIKLNVQVNDELTEAVEDIYRVNGITANVEVIDRGKVQVHTRTNDLDKLSSVETSVQNDIPSVIEIKVVNSPPGTVLKTEKPARQDPDKRVTLIVAGTNAYIMTQDLSRYFIGALLPSGHLVESIENGEVVVSKDGKQEILKY